MLLRQHTEPLSPKQWHQLRAEKTKPTYSSQPAVASLWVTHTRSLTQTGQFPNLFQRLSKKTEEDQIAQYGVNEQVDEDTKLTKERTKV